MGVKEVSDKVTFWQEKIFRQNDLFLVTFYKDLCLGKITEGRVFAKSVWFENYSF